MSAAVLDEIDRVIDAVILDWRAPSHWAPRAARCRRCRRGFTHLRDDAGRPSHKVCAENELAAKAGLS